MTHDRDDKLATVVRQFLEALGDGPDHGALADTPKRVADAWREFTSGYNVDVASIFQDGVFPEAHRGLVLVRNIDFYSVCEHHLVPFFGKCHVGYVPNGKIIGLSKIARVVEAFARRLQVQERMTDEIAGVLETYLAPTGVAVVVEAQHLCMMMRGVEQGNAVVTTSATTGSFKTDAALVAELHAQIGAHLSD